MREKIVTVCLGEDHIWRNRKDAIAHFREKAESCPPASLDRTHYEDVLSKLEAGRTVARDWD